MSHESLLLPSFNCGRMQPTVLVSLVMGEAKQMKNKWTCVRLAGSRFILGVDEARSQMKPPNKEWIDTHFESHNINAPSYGSSNRGREA